MNEETGPQQQPDQAPAAIEAGTTTNTRRKRRLSVWQLIALAVTAVFLTVAVFVGLFVFKMYNDARGIWHDITHWGVHTTTVQHEITDKMVIGRLNGTSRLIVSVAPVSDTEAVIDHPKVCVNLPLIGQHCAYYWWSQAERTAVITGQAQGVVSLADSSEVYTQDGKQVIQFNLPVPTMQFRTDEVRAGPTSIQFFGHSSPNWAITAYTAGKAKILTRLNTPSNGYIARSEADAFHALVNLEKGLGVRIVVVFGDGHRFQTGPNG